MFKNLFGGEGKPKKSESSVAPLAPALAQSILGVVGKNSIPGMPGAAQKAFQLATDPNAEARDFVEVIESDESLSARVVKIANSVYFDRGQPSKTIEDSVVVIGMNELRCLLNATALSDIFPSRSPVRAQLWANDISTALIGRHLAKRFLPERADLVFLAGLMHDVGKLLLLQRLGPEYEKVIRHVDETGDSFQDSEVAFFPFNHTDVGQLIAERWSFSPELIEAIRHHHDTPSDPVGRPGVTTLVFCSNTISHALGLGHPSTRFRVRQKAEERLTEVWSILAVAQGERKEILDQCRRIFESEYDLYANPSDGRSSL